MMLNWEYLSTLEGYSSGEKITTRSSDWHFSKTGELWNNEFAVLMLPIYWMTFLWTFGIAFKLQRFFYIDVSSVFPRFEPANLPSREIEAIPERSEPDFEYDIFVKMAPLASFRTSVQVTKFERAAPRPVPPEDHQ